MKHIDGQQRRLRVVGEDIGILALGGGDPLLLVHLFHRSEQVSHPAGFFKAHFRGREFHAPAQLMAEIAKTPFQKHADVANRSGIVFRRRQALHAGTPATMDVILQTRMRVAPVEIDLAGGNQKMPVDEMHQPVRQVARKIWSEITRAILQKAAGHIHPGPFLVCQLDVGISFVIAQ